MANFVTPVVAQLGTASVDSEALNAVGTEAKDTEGRTWRYMAGVGSCVQGSVVTYDEAGVTALIAANAKGDVAVAGAAVVASTYGWFCVEAEGGCPTMVAANCADNAFVGREGADGVVGDGRSAGDQIYNFITRGSTSGDAALTTCQFFRPRVDDIYGS